MTEKPFNRLSIAFQNRPTKRIFPPKEFKIKENYGLDTETLKGYVNLISDSDGKYKININSLDEILNFLTHEKFEKSFNWFFNVRFDFESIIKHLGSKKKLMELYENGKIKHNAYTISFLPSKFFSIAFNHHLYSFYDLNNFLETSLDNAAKTYLGESKIDTIDRNKLNTDKNYWEQNSNEIIKYCIKDALLTKKLADYFWDIIYKNLVFYPRKPFSKGKLSEEYFLNKCYIPTIKDIPMPVLELAHNNYSGGRFELLKRGFFDEVYVYDIKSAYPYQMTTLLDYAEGKWEKIKTRRYSDYEPNGDLGFYSCNVEAKEPYFSPFLIKAGNLNVYPNGKFHQFLNSYELDFIKKYFPDCKIKIIKGYEFNILSEYHPFKDEIERLYKWKEREKDETLKYCVKIILNSLYGKTWQIIKTRTGNLISGKMYNPIYASLITSKTRIKLLEMALQSPDDIISFATDGVASTEPLPIKSKIKLGDFDIEFKGSGIFLMSGMYTLYNPKKIKGKLRGFKIYKDTVPNILDILEIEDKKENEKTLIDILNSMQYSKKYEFLKSRPYHLGECLLHHKKLTFHDINIFHDEPKTININGDIKRHWIREFKNGYDVLKNNISSYPLQF